MTTAIRNPIKSLCRAGWTLTFVPSLPGNMWAEANIATKIVTVAIDRFSSDEQLATMLTHEANHAVMHTIKGTV